MYHARTTFIDMYQRTKSSECTPTSFIHPLEIRVQIYISSQGKLNIFKPCCFYILYFYGSISLQAELTMVTYFSCLEHQDMSCCQSKVFNLEYPVSIPSHIRLSFTPKKLFRRSSCHNFQTAPNSILKKILNTPKQKNVSVQVLIFSLNR